MAGVRRFLLVSDPPKPESLHPQTLTWQATLALAKARVRPGGTIPLAWSPCLSGSKHLASCIGDGALGLIQMCASCRTPRARLPQVRVAGVAPCCHHCASQQQTQPALQRARTRSGPWSAQTCRSLRESRRTGTGPRPSQATPTRAQACRMGWSPSPRTASFTTANRPFQPHSPLLWGGFRPQGVLPYTYRKILEMLLKLMKVCYNGEQVQRCLPVRLWSERPLDCRQVKSGNFDGLMLIFHTLQTSENYSSTVSSSLLMRTRMSSHELGVSVISTPCLLALTLSNPLEYPAARRACRLS